MIRTVVAVLLTVAILGVSVPALERGAGVNSENAVEAEITEIANAAESLYQNEQAPPEGVAGPQRTLSITFPEDTLQSEPVKNVSIIRKDGFSLVRYRIAGRTERKKTIDAPIVNVDRENTTVMEGGGKRDLRLELRKKNSTSFVVLSRA